MMENTQKFPDSGVPTVMARGARADVYIKRTNTEESVSKYYLCIFSAKLS